MVSIKQFCNTPEEWHSLVLGWSEAMCPWRPRLPMPLEYKNPLDSEYHYYSFGRAAGVFTWVGMIAGCAKLLL